MPYYRKVKANKFNFGFFTYFVFCIILGVFILELGLLGIAIGIGLLTYQSGVELDTDNNKYRSFMKILGYRLGEWRVLPKVNYVTVVRSLAITSETESGAAAGFEYQYNLNLAVEDRKRIIKLGTYELKPALEEALQIGDALQLKVYDCSSPDKKWIR